MKLRYLGTAAAEGWPAVFCRCPHCDRARAAGGRNIRTRSQAMINSDMLIDFPPDANMHMLTNNIDYSAIKFLLVTHPHSDHFAPLDLAFRDDAYYAHNLTEEKLILAGPQRVIDAYENYFGRFSDERRCKYITPMVLENYVTYEFGDYKVTPIRANHTRDENNACCYIINDGSRTLLYLHDTGLLYDDVWEYLESNKIKADFVSLDCTFVTLPGSGGHLGLDTCKITADMMREKGIADDKTVFCVNHFSHNGGAIYDELVPIAAKDGFLTSYDGMEIEF